MGLFSALGGIVSGFVSAGAARRASRRALDEKKAAQTRLNHEERNRQTIISPYDNIKDLSALAQDLSGKLSNPFASLGVSTAAAEMQIEEADIALANTLDTLRATGASAGGATALAQAALQSKKGVAASIEQQEAQNEKLRAQGQSQLERLQLAEGQRIQNIQISEGGREQESIAAGRAFKFNAQERRQQDKIDYLRGEKDAARYRYEGAEYRKSQAVGNIVSSIGGAVDSFTGAGGFGSGGFGTAMKKMAKS